MVCKVCDAKLIEENFIHCDSCENLRRRWETYYEENNIYKKRREYKIAGRKKKEWNQKN